MRNALHELCLWDMQHPDGAIDIWATTAKALAHRGYVVIDGVSDCRNFNFSAVIWHSSRLPEWKCDVHELLRMLALGCFYHMREQAGHVYSDRRVQRRAFRYGRRAMRRFLHYSERARLADISGFFSTPWPPATRLQSRDEQGDSVGYPHLLILCCED